MFTLVYNDHTCLFELNALKSATLTGCTNKYKRILSPTATTIDNRN